MVGELEDREQLLVSAWLGGLRSPRTRRAYAADLVACGVPELGLEA